MRRRVVHAVTALLWAPLVVASDGEPAVPAPETHIVEIREMAFHPAELRVRQGDTIEWVNLDFVPHTATASDSAWTSPTLAQGERWRMVAGEADAGPYICAFHPVMEARVILDPSTSAKE